MWFLKSNKKEDVYYYFLNEDNYAVGRKDAVILIADDPSISRRHAVFTVTHLESNLSNPKKLPVLMLKDIGSKYGTFLNGVEKVGPEGVLLNIGDKVTFGQCESSFNIYYQPLVVTTSCIDSEGKQQLKNSIKKLGGHIVQEWSTDCTCLVMTDIKVTIKAVCAMVSLKPLVTPQYFCDLIQSVQEQRSHPNVEDYLPELGELILDREKTSFNFQAERKALFKNKTFICTSEKQYKKLHLGITLADGKVIIANKETDIKASLLLHPDTCVMKYQANSSQSFQQTPSHILKIEEELKRNNKRVIPESDIGLAVVYCSTEKYCNPSYSIASALFCMSKLQSQTLSQQNVYVEETPQSSTNAASIKCNTKYESYIVETESKSQQNNLENASKSSLSSNNKKRNRNDELNEPETSIKQIKLQDPEKNTKEAKSPCASRSTDRRTEMIQIKKEFISPISNKDITLLQNLNRQNIDDTASIANQVGESESVPDVKMENESTGQNFKLNISIDEMSDENVINKNNIQQTQVIKSKSDIKVPEGFLTSIHNVDRSMDERSDAQQIDENLPSKLVNVEFASLCPIRNCPATWVTRNDASEHNRSVKNFKKFRKVFSTANRLPRIIGGRDLIVYTRSSKAMDDWLSQNPVSQSQETEEDGLFDWDKNQKKRKR